MSLNPPRPTHVGQIWVDPISAAQYVWEGKPEDDYAWKGWKLWKNPPPQYPPVDPSLPDRDEKEPA